MKQKTVSQLKKILWKIFSEYIRKRDQGVCYTCNKKDEWKNMQAGHYVSRSHNSLLFDERNVHCQCRACNIFKKGNIDSYALHLTKDYGTHILEILDYEKHQIKQFTIMELEDLIKVYKNKILTL